MQARRVSFGSFPVTAEGLLILEVRCSRVESGVKEDSRRLESYGEQARVDQRSRHGEYIFQSAKDSPRQTLRLT